MMGALTSYNTPSTITGALTSECKLEQYWEWDKVHEAPVST